MKFIAFSLSLCFAIAGNAQHHFIVYQVSGNVYLQQHSNKSRLSTGQQLSNDAVLSLSPGSSVLLICSNYKPVRIQEPGLVQLGNYVSECEKKMLSISHWYWSYIWEELTNPKQKPEKNHKLFMRRKGGIEIERGCVGLEFYAIFDTLNFYIKSIPTLRWKTDLNPSRLTFVIYDALNPLEGKQVYSSAVKGHSIFLKEVVGLMESDKDYFWTVLVDSMELCKRKILRKWSSSKYEEFMTLVNKETALLQDRSSISMMRGLWHESNNFVFEAYQDYRKANTYSPQNLPAKRNWNGFKKLF